MQTKQFTKESGQAGLKILLIISILIFITSYAIVFLLNVQKKTRDSERMTTITSLQKAIDLYYDAFSKWPAGDNDGDGWDEGFHSENDRRFIQPLVDHKFLPSSVSDPVFYGAKSFKYAVYEPGFAGCPRAKGSFYVLGITEMESDTRPPKEFTGSGFSCAKRDWGKEFDYVVGKFTNE
ncbi:MAG: hypothetical protein NT091_00660 [Candidatus Falkowbacteria bacterium]|nr:hypothetical protein [Candidatus Falkowbacteria bacterium]